MQQSYYKKIQIAELFVFIYNENWYHSYNVIFSVINSIGNIILRQNLSGRVDLSFGCLDSLENPVVYSLGKTIIDFFINGFFHVIVLLLDLHYKFKYKLIHIIKLY